MNVDESFRTITFVLALSLLPLAVYASGRIEGRVRTADDEGLSGVVVVVDQLSTAEVTDAHGRFSFDRVPPGSYRLTISGVDRVETETVEVVDGATSQVDKVVEWRPTYAESITVFSASRRTERLFEAPASISIVSEEKIERELAHGQLPKLLDSLAGVETVQNGVYDYHFNVRGFNQALNRRVLLLIDGRDPGSILSGPPEWAAYTFQLDDLASVELFRGPGSALYGPNALNGVLSVTSTEPRDTQGSKGRLTFGEEDTVRADLRYAGQLGENTYYRVGGGYTQGKTYSRSRNETTEYPGLAAESIPLPNDEQIVVGHLSGDFAHSIQCIAQFDADQLGPFLCLGQLGCCCEAFVGSPERVALAHGGGEWLGRGIHVARCHAVGHCLGQFIDAFARDG